MITDRHHFTVCSSNDNRIVNSQINGRDAFSPKQWLMLTCASALTLIRKDNLSTETNESISEQVGGKSDYTQLIE